MVIVAEGSYSNDSDIPGYWLFSFLRSSNSAEYTKNAIFDILKVSFSLFDSYW